MTPPDGMAARWGRYVLLGIVALLCVAPAVAVVLPLLRSPLQTLADLNALLHSPRLWMLWAKTCGIALGTAALATAIGAPLGALLHAPGQGRGGWLRVFLSAPLFIPAHVLAVAWIDLLGQQGILSDMFAVPGLTAPPFPLYTPTGVVLVQALCWYPIPLWCLWNGLRHLDPALVDAARNLGARRAARYTFVCRLLLPAAITGALLVFLLSLLSFSVPALLQVPVFTVEIYTSFNSLLDQQQAVLMALPLVLTGLLAVVLALRIHRPVAGFVPPGHGIHRLHAGWLSRTFAVVIAALAVGLPLAALVIRSMPFSTLVAAWNTGLGEMGVSVLVAASAATLMLGVALCLAARPASSTSGVPIAGGVAFLVSGPVFGVGLIHLWNHPGLPGLFYDHVSILILAVSGRYFIVAWLGCRLALRWLPREIMEAARNLGASRGHRMRTIALSALRGPLFAVWACLVLLIMGDIEGIVLVAPPGWTPVSLRIFTLMHYGPAAMVSALALLQILASLSLLAAVNCLASPAK